MTFSAIGTPAASAELPAGVTLAAFKAYAKLDNSLEDDIAAAVLAGSVAFCGEWAGKDFAATPPTSKMIVAIYAIALHWMANREAAAPVTISEVPFAARAILDQERGIVV